MPWLGIERFRTLLKAFKRGVYTIGDAAFAVGQCAIVEDFFDYLDEIPPELLSEIRTNAEHVPGHPEDVLIVASYCGDATLEELAEQDRKERERRYWSRRLLQQHFYPDRRPEPFEPIRSIGLVEETIEYESEVVVLGDLSDYLVRSHPVQLHPPAMPMLVTRLEGGTRVLRDVERNSDDYVWKRNGRSELVFGPEVRSPDDVAPGTEVFVDRSGLPPLPDEPPAELLD